MRKIQTQDVFKLARIIKQANMKETIADLIKRGQAAGKAEDKDGVVESIGIEVFIALIEAAGDEKMEQKIYDLLDGITEKKIKEQSLDVTFEDIKQIIRENDIKSFFNTASRLTI